MALLTVWTSNFLKAVFFHHAVWILFTTLGTCLLLSASFPIFIFLAFEALHWYWDILFNPLKTITDCHLLESMVLTKCQDERVGLDLFFTFSNCDSSDVCHSLFSQSSCHLLCSSQGQLSTSDNFFRSIQSFMGICSAFGSVEAFSLRMFSASQRLSTPTSKFPFQAFFTFSG